MSSNPSDGWSAAEVVVVKLAFDTVVGKVDGAPVKVVGIATCINSASGMTSVVLG